jgi:hypothetical protein
VGFGKPTAGSPGQSSGRNPGKGLQPRRIYARPQRVDSALNKIAFNKNPVSLTISPNNHSSFAKIILIGPFY